MTNPFSMWIHGRAESSSSRPTLPIIDPSNGHEVGHLPLIDRAQIEEVLRSSAQGLAAWRGFSAGERAAVLRSCSRLLAARRADLAMRITQDQGKPLTQAVDEVDFACEIFEWAAGEAQRLYGRVIPGTEASQRQLAIREPLGVVAAITPWNFPLATPAGKLACGLAAGCAIVLKPSELTPGGSIGLVEVISEAGLPPGTVNLIFGNPRELSDQLLGSSVVRGVHFTGSTEVGRGLAALAARQLQRCVLELGGHAPVIVCDDVDARYVARLAAAVKTYNAGQVCTNPSRFYVHISQYERFVEELAIALAAIRVGDGREDMTQMGPLAHAGRVEIMENLVTDAVGQGARQVLGGRRLDRRGFFFPPTVLADVPDSARIMREEPFGPIAPVQPFHDLGDAIRKANALPYGLAAMAFTGSRKTAELLARSLEAGMVAINRFRVGFAETPFGGIKQSGYGSEYGIEGMDGFLVTKFVSENNPLDA